MKINKSALNMMKALTASSTNTIDASPEHKYLPNIGACLDLPVGIYHLTKQGRWVNNGGLAFTTGISARGNSFKSSLLNYMLLTALVRTIDGVGSGYCAIYDTETTLHRATVFNTLRTILNYTPLEGIEDPEELITNDTLVLTDATMYSGNGFINKLRTMLDEKIKAGKKLEVPTPLLNADGSQFMISWPWQSAIDSLTDFKSDRIIKVDTDNDLGDSKANTMFAMGALDKYRLLASLNADTAMYSNYMIMTGQIGKKLDMSGGRGGGMTKDIGTMRFDEKITGVSSKFFYSLGNSWQAITAVPLTMDLSSKVKVPRYPKDSSQTTEHNQDLNVVVLKMLRSKSGPSYTEEHIVVSQKEGVQPTLTEFYRCDVRRKHYGMEGNDRNYTMTLYPECKLNRVIVRRKIDNDKRLRRAINITSELSQIYDYHRDLYRDLYMSPKDLYEKLIELGYDWNKILDTTWYYTVGVYENNESLPVTTMDLLQMAHGKLEIAYLKADNKPKPKPKK